MSSTETSTAYSVPSVERAITLLRFIGDGNRARNLSNVSRDLKINRTTLIRLIHTLLDQRMIEEIGEDSGYRLGAGLVALGAQAIQGRDIVRVCQPILQDLCKTTGMSAHLGVLDGSDIIYLSRETPNSHLVSNVREGSRLLAHASSIGRSILAELTDDRIREIYAGEEIAQSTSKTPTTVEAIILQAKSDQELGAAWSQGNFESGIGSCAAAIFDHTGLPVGGLNVSGPESRFADVNAEEGAALRKTLIDAAGTASAEMGFVA